MGSHMLSLSVRGQAGVQASLLANAYRLPAAAWAIPMASPAWLSPTCNELQGPFPGRDRLGALRGGDRPAIETIPSLEQAMQF